MPPKATLPGYQLAHLKDPFARVQLLRAGFAEGIGIGVPARFIADSIRIGGLKRALLPLDPRSARHSKRRTKTRSLLPNLDEAWAAWPEILAGYGLGKELGAVPVMAPGTGLAVNCKTAPVKLIAIWQHDHEPRAKPKKLATPASKESDHVTKILPTPTPQDIEAALTTMRNGMSAYGRWMRLENSLRYVLFVLSDGRNAYSRCVLTNDSLENDYRAKAEADCLWWVTIIEPDGEEGLVLGGGTTLAEAAAVAWINSCIGSSWSESGLSDEDDAKVPRHVPEGWQFELYAEPVRHAALKVIQGAPGLLASDKVRGCERSPWSGIDPSLD